MPALGAIDMAEVVSDPDLCQSLTVSRSSGSSLQGGWEETRTQFPAYGVVTVASDRTLRMFPEAGRIEGSVSFFTTIPLFASIQQRRQVRVIS